MRWQLTSEKTCLYLHFSSFFKWSRDAKYLIIFFRVNYNNLLWGLGFYQAHPKVLKNDQFGPSSLASFVHYLLNYFFFPILLLSLHARKFLSSVSNLKLSLIFETLMAEHLNTTISEHHCHHKQWFGSLPLLSPSSSLSILRIRAPPSFCLADLELSPETKHQSWPSLHDFIYDQPKSKPPQPSLKIAFFSLQSHQSKWSRPSMLLHG